MLNLQKRGVSDPAARLHVIGRIQRQLYGPRGELVSLDTFFLHELTENLLAAGGKPGIAHVVEAEPGVVLLPDTVVPIALIMTEAISNALEHGYPETGPSTIAIALERPATMIELSVRDDGRGLPDGFELANAESLGLRLARTLAGNLRGELILRPAQPGTRMRLRFPAPPPCALSAAHGAGA